MSSSKTSIVLKDTKDWKKWLEVILTAAREYHLLEYVDPDIAIANLKVFPLPVEPTPNMILPSIVEGTITRFSELDDRQARELSYELSLYQTRKKDFDRHEQAMGQLRIKIQETVHSDNLVYTFNCQTVYQMLSKLKERFAPSDFASKQECALQWRKLCVPPKRGQDLDHWLQTIETKYDECVLLNIPDVQDEWPLYLYLTAIEGVSNSFAETWRIKVISGEQLSFKELV